MAQLPSFDEIAETFDLMDDWDDRYRYVIDLGKALPGLPDADRTPETKVDGCASQVWLAIERVDGVDGAPRLRFRGDSDAHIVRGLIAILTALVSDRPAAEVAASDPLDAFRKLGLEGQLSRQRSNGLAAMALRLRTAAAEAL